VLESARALREQGAADNVAGRPVEAARSLTAALEEIERSGGDTPSREHLELRCRTLTTLALTELMLSGLERAVARLA
jgi:hypothetical protein